jgi:malonyl-CoA O-methyltransferase
VTQAQVLDKRALRRFFGRAARGYDRAAVLQQEVGARALERLQLIRIDPALILDAGCGTGGSAAALRARFPRARLLELDLAPEMLDVARDRLSGGQSRWRNFFSPTWWRGSARNIFLCADNEQLPLRTGTVDLLWSNLAFQWANDISKILKECRRVLRPGGLLMFSTLGPDTLKELRQAFAADAGRPHVNRFIDMHDIGDMLVQAGFGDPVMDMEQLTLTYQNLNALTSDLRATGSQNVHPDRRRGLTGRQLIMSVELAYERYRQEGRLPATFEVIYGHAWKPEPRTGPGGRPVIEIMPSQET